MVALVDEVVDSDIELRVLMLEVFLQVAGDVDEILILEINQVAHEVDHHFPFEVLDFAGLLSFQEAREFGKGGD